MLDIKRFFYIFLIVHLIFMSPASDLVLCWGEEGHLAIEGMAKGKECCEHLNSKQGNPQPDKPRENIKSDNQCPPCWDIPVAFQSALVIIPNPHFEITTFTADVADVFIQFEFSPHSELYKNTSKLPAFHTALLNLKTVHLLI